MCADTSAGINMIAGSESVGKDLPLTNHVKAFVLLSACTSTENAGESTLWLHVQCSLLCIVFYVTYRTK